MEKSQQRKQLEEKVLEATDKVIKKIEPDDPLWIMDAEVAEIIPAWRNLVTHYQWSDDTEISVLVVREYVRLRDVFSLIETSETDPSSIVPIPPEAKKQARHYINYLEYFMDEIIKAVERVVNN